MNVARLDTHLTSKWVDDTGAVGADEARLRLAVQRSHHLRDVAHVNTTFRAEFAKTNTNLISLRNALSDAGDEANFILNGLNDGIGRKGRRDVDDGCIRLSLSDSLPRVCQSTQTK